MWVRPATCFELIVAAVLSLVPAAASTQILRVSVSSSGHETQGGPAILSPPSPSRDGRWVAFESRRPGFVPEDQDDVGDVFLRDNVLGTTTRVSVGSGNQPAGGPSSDPVISADGRYIAFASTGAALAPGPRHPCFEHAIPCASIYVYDRVTATLRRVSVGPGGEEPNGWSSAPSLSADGRYVAYRSWASNLVEHDTNGGADVFVFDLVASTTTRVSVGTGGEQASFGRTPDYDDRPSISADGHVVAFSSSAVNLAPPDTNENCYIVLIGWANCPDVYVHDRRTKVTTRVSVNSRGEQADKGGLSPVMTPDGRYVAFMSAADNLGAGTLHVPFFNGRHGAIVYLHDRVTGVTTPAPMPRTSAARPSISDDGMLLAFESLGAVDLTNPRLQEDVYVWDREAGAVRLAATTPAGVRTSQSTRLPALSADGRSLTFVTASPELVASDTNGADDVFLLDPIDLDRDGLPTHWEISLGGDPFSSAGAEGASGDPDGDGRSNLQEFHAMTHPRGLASATRYFAEGATSAFFETRFSIANPSDRTARALLRFALADGSVRSAILVIPAMQSRKLVASLVPGLATGEFATTVESDTPIVAERQMWWSAGNAYGSHAEHALEAPSSTWYFAEGATHSGFDLFYLLQNPGDSTSEVRVRYLRPQEPPLEKQYLLPPRSRTNIWVDVEQFDGQAVLTAADVSAVIEVTRGPAIIAERAMYFSPAGQGGRVFDAGHEAAGVTVPATEWFLAEGATGDYFDLFVLIANPSDEPAELEAIYLLPDGTIVSRRHRVSAMSRYNIWVDQEGARLADTAVSTVIRSLNGVPVVVERAMWWPGPTSATWAEAHVSSGSTSTAARWAVADGVVQDTPAAADTYVLIANSGAADAAVKVTLLYDDGGPADARVFTVRAQSRFNVDVRAEFPTASRRGFGVLVEGNVGDALTVERSIYSDAEGRRWAAGSNARATRLP